MTYLAKTGRRARARRARPMGDDSDFFNEIGTLPASSAEPTDNVNQTAGGGTSTSISDFVSVGGVCKPQNFPALAAVKALQQQLNRVAQVKGLPKIVADGTIGAQTLALFRSVQNLATGSVMGDASSCLNVAADSDVLGAQVKAVADGLGAPAQVSGKLSLAPSTILTKSNKLIAAPDSGILGSLSSLSDVEKIALVGVAGGIGYLALTKRKRRK